MIDNVRLAEEFKHNVDKGDIPSKHLRNELAKLVMLAGLGIGSVSTPVLAAEADAIIDEGQKQEQRLIRAQEEAGLHPNFPRIDGEIVFELQNDWQYDSSETENKFNNLFTTTEGDFNLFPFGALEGLFINLHLTLEQTNEFSGAGDKIFEQQGLFIENISLNYEADWWSVIGGKYGPNFSIAYDAAPGIYGTDFAEEDIEIAEQLGFGGSLTYAHKDYGAHTFSGSVFKADRSFMSGSIINNRGMTSSSDGGPSNTSSFSSGTFVVDGAGFAFAPGLTYQIGGAYLDTNRVVDEETGDILPSSETEGEVRFVAATQYAIDITDDIAITPLVEYVRFWNGGGVEDEDRDYLTGSMLFTYQNWNLAVATTQRWTDPAEGSTFNDNQWQVSAGYLFDFGLGIDVGWKYMTEDGVNTRTLGALATYVLEF